MPAFSKRSLARLETCHHHLVMLFLEVIKHFDCTVLCGHRSEEEQKKLYQEGKTKVLHSKHNLLPSLAVDVAPYPIDWRGRERFIFFGGFVLGVASQMGIKVRWGGDWNMDTRLRDNKFDDLVHFELVMK